MKTVSVAIDDATWEAVSQVAEVQHTNVDGLVIGFLKQVAQGQENGEGAGRRARARKELVKALRQCGAVVGEKPTRERTYGDRRFHRY